MLSRQQASSVRFFEKTSGGSAPIFSCAILETLRPAWVFVKGI